MARQFSFRQKFNPDLSDPTVADLPARSIFSAAGLSATLTLVLYQLAQINAFGVESLLQEIGKVLIPGSQGVDPTKGYLGSDAGIFAVYFIVFIVWWLSDLNLPFLTIDRLPQFVIGIHILHALLAWQLFSPWIAIG